MDGSFPPMGSPMDVREHPVDNISHPEPGPRFGKQHGLVDYFMAGAKDFSSEVSSQLQGKGSVGYPVGPHVKELLDQDQYRKVNKLDK